MQLGLFETNTIQPWILTLKLLSDIFHLAYFLFLNSLTSYLLNLPPILVHLSFFHSMDLVGAMRNNTIVEHYHIQCGGLRVEITEEEEEPLAFAARTRICFKTNGVGRSDNDDDEISFTFGSLNMFRTSDFSDFAVTHMLDSSRPMEEFSSYKEVITAALISNAQRSYTSNRIKITFSTDNDAVRTFVVITLTFSMPEGTDDGDVDVGSRPRPTSRDYVEHLEKVRFDESPSCGGQLGVESCAVCQDDYVAGAEITRLPCSHVFHEKCLCPWLEQSNVCPLCRYEMPIETTEMA